MPRIQTLPILLLVLPGCANGGSETRPQSDVKIAASHHLFSFRSLRGFGTFPVPKTVVSTSHEKLNLFDDSSYTLSDGSTASAPDRYAIGTDGAFSVYATGTGHEPSVVFLGGYSLVGNQADFFFTDRVDSPSSPRVGLYYGTRVLVGQVELAGAWHVLSLHTVFDATIPGADNVGRGAHGGVSISADAPGTSRTISGTGMQGTSSLVFGGTIQNLLTNNSGDGTCNLALSYQLSGQVADSRVMQAVATDNLVIGLDDGVDDGEAGIMMMVRKFDAPATPIDSVRVPGTFLVGGHTLFVNPTNSGSDAFVGVVTLTAQGAFRLEASGSSGQPFTYIGTYTLAADGGMTLSISGTNETWFAAIDKSYNSFAFVDDFVELRSNNIPELNFGFGVRQKL